MLFINPPFGNYLEFTGALSIRGSFTLNPRPGLVGQILKTLRYDFERQGWVNKIGLRNPGIDYAIQKYQHDKRSIVSVAVLEHSEIPALVAKIPPSMNLEINVSCPNVDVREKERIDNALFRFLHTERTWCIVKLSPLVEPSLIDNYYEQGFRQFHCSNTVPLPNGGGGLSGKEIMRYNEKIIPYIRETYPDTVIIAGGGVQTEADMRHYRALGADHCSCSTLFFNPIAACFLLSAL